MTTTRKYFGTDGIRGKVGQAPITADFILQLGFAVGRVFNEAGQGKVLIGKDTRISGYMFESALEAGLSAAGTDICLLGPMPTPAIAYLTRTFHAQAGIVISASHNPYYDNGIKFFSKDGTKLPDEVELKIEAELESGITIVDSAHLGKASRIEDAAGRYIEFCKSTVPMGFSLSGLKIILDCANGATYHVAPSVLRELGATVITLGTEPNGININDNCGALHTASLQKLVIEENADLGIALDGDGDRLMMVDHKGTLVDGDGILFVLADHWHQTGHLNGGLVGTLMSNLGLELACKDKGIPFTRTQVGDRYVIEELINRNWNLGGETSGHILCRNMTTTGDGIISALQVLKVMADRGESLFDLRSKLSKFPQVIRNVVVKDKHGVYQQPCVKQALTQGEQTLKQRGRILLRASGTEPVIRVMVEGEDDVLINKVADDIASVVDQVK